jgi:hypothetical protein
MIYHKILGFTVLSPQYCDVSFVRTIESSFSLKPRNWMFSIHSYGLNYDRMHEKYQKLCQKLCILMLCILILIF